MSSWQKLTRAFTYHSTYFQIWNQLTICTAHTCSKPKMLQTHLKTLPLHYHQGQSLWGVRLPDRHLPGIRESEPGSLPLTVLENKNHGLPYSWDPHLWILKIAAQNLCLYRTGTAIFFWVIIPQPMQENNCLQHALYDESSRDCLSIWEEVKAACKYYACIYGCAHLQSALSTGVQEPISIDAEELQLLSKHPD